MKKIIILVVSLTLFVFFGCLSTKQWTKEDFSNNENKNYQIDEISIQFSPRIIKGLGVTNQVAKDFFNEVPVEKIKNTIERELGIILSDLKEIEDFKNSPDNLEYEKLPLDWGARFCYKSKQNLNDIKIRIRYSVSETDGSWFFMFRIVFDKSDDPKKEIVIKEYLNGKQQGGSTSLEDYKKWIIAPANTMNLGREPIFVY